ncbi:MAG: HEPN domain-containing protein [Chloroflexota bacterium]|nr:HEPN domain-containing protein [Chloroflexota bacterium]
MQEGSEEAKRWLDHSELDLRTALRAINSFLFPDACLLCEQSAEEALKAYLIFKTGQPVSEEQSAEALAERCLEYDERFNTAANNARALKRYYASTTDDSPTLALHPGPCSEKDAVDAVNASREIVETVKRALGRS